MACPICVEDYTDDDDVCECLHCGYHCCNACTERFLFDHTSDKCMNCNKPWDIEFILMSFPRKWITKVYYDKILAKRLTEIEKSKLPDTQVEATIVGEHRALRADINNLPTNKDLEKQAKKLSHPGSSKADVEAIYNRLHAERNREKSLLDMKASHLATQSAILSKLVGVDYKRPVRSNLYIMKCPFDSCRGFIDSKHVCGTCKRHICPRCHETDDVQPHKCNPDSIASAALIEKETRPCPKCKTRIFKISGCSQMYCTMEGCHAVFDWNTGNLDFGNIHNPEYFRELHEGKITRTGLDGQRLQDILNEATCGFYNIENMPGEVLVQVIRSLSDYKLEKMAMKLYNRVVHWINDTLKSLGEDKIHDNIDVRVDFLLGEIPESKFKSTILHREKRRIKYRAFRELVETSVTVYSNLFYMVIGRKIGYNEVTESSQNWSSYMFDRINQLAELYGDVPVENIIEA